MMNNQKGFIQIPILIAIIVSIVVVSGISYGTIEYNKTSNIIKETDQLTKEEKYNEAIEKLEITQNRWLVKNLGIKRQEIANKIESNKTLLEDKLEYTQGLEEFNKGNWEQAKDLLSKVSEISHYYQDAKNKVEETQKRITEKQVAEAVGKNREEVKRETEEERARRIATEIQLQFERQRMQEEKAKRIAAETRLQYERQITQEEITKLQLERQEAWEQWGEAGRKLAIEELLRIGNLLQDYYNEIRKARNLGQNWWSYDPQEEVNFASNLAKHGVGAVYWEEYESTYHSQSGSYSYLDAKEKLDKVIFIPYTAGVSYEDSDYEKIRKILNFFYFHIHYEHDFNQILRAPAETLGLKSGDCDDWSILASAAFADAGIDSAIMFVKSKDGTQMHAMVLVQSKETLPLWYYSDLTNYGLPSGRWWIIEPQFTLEEQSQHPEWFTLWDIVAAALVGKIESSTESKENVSESLWCNGQYWSSCPPGQKFHCPKTGNPFCYSAEAIVCNDKVWSSCPTGQKFICPSVGDPYCE